MRKTTYLQESLNNGRIIRWPTSTMPIAVYVSPFHFYSAKGEDYKYRGMAKSAFAAWEKTGMAKFFLVENLNSSQINLTWKRVDRKSLGQCHFHYDKLGRLYSAEVQIGISDGIIHHQYMDDNEVYHTILHEVGHALGLGHSPNRGDIMFVPHEYGVSKISAGDFETLKWLYHFDIGKSADEIIAKHGGGAGTLDDLVLKLKGGFKRTLEEIAPLPQKDLLEEVNNIAELKKYVMELQKIRLPKQGE